MFRIFIEEGSGGTPTGIPGLDEILGGGLPQGRVVLVLGSRCGKDHTVLAVSSNGIRLGESGLFVSMEEGKGHYWREMNAFGWDLEAAEKSGSTNSSTLHP